MALSKTNKDYNLILYYDMQLVTFGIDEKTNLIVQFPVFVQPYIHREKISNVSN